MIEEQAVGTDTSMRSSRRGSYSLLKTASIAKLATEVDVKAPVVVSKVTSEVYNDQCPPRDWADIGLLIPHEAIRREMDGMERSVNAMEPDDPAWKYKYFSRWYIEYFYQSVHDHHDNEEEIYFPWISTKAELPEKLCKSHVELVEMMDAIKGHCEELLKEEKGGGDSNGKSTAIAGLKKLVPKFVSEMRTHLKEEEEAVPTLLRTNFTQEEEEAVVQQILQKGGMDEVRAFLPSILLAMKEWGTPEFYDDFVGSMPPPVREVLLEKFLPDYNTFVHPMRDAPTMDSEPKLTTTAAANEDDGNGATGSCANTGAPATDKGPAEPTKTKDDLDAMSQKGCCTIL